MTPRPRSSRIAAASSPSRSRSTSSVWAPSAGPAHSVRPGVVVSFGARAGQLEGAALGRRDLPQATLLEVRIGGDRRGVVDRAGWDPRGRQREDNLVARAASGPRRDGCVDPLDLLDPPRVRGERGIRGEVLAPRDPHERREEAVGVGADDDRATVLAEVPGRSAAW
jgi:hypothetical protein